MTEQNQIAEDLAVEISNKIRLGEFAFCPDCGGDGHLGTCSNGKHRACEMCGGHEDGLGTGLNYAPEELIAIIAETYAEQMEELTEYKKYASNVEYYDHWIHDESRKGTTIKGESDND